MNIEGAIAILKILIFFRRHGYIPVGYRHSRNSDWLGSISRNAYERKLVTQMQHLVYERGPFKRS